MKFIDLVSFFCSVLVYRVWLFLFVKDLSWWVVFVIIGNIKLGYRFCLKGICIWICGCFVKICENKLMLLLKD